MEDAYSPSASHLLEGAVFDALFKSLDKEGTGRVDRGEILRYLLQLAGSDQAGAVVDEHMDKKDAIVVG